MCTQFPYMLNWCTVPPLSFFLCLYPCAFACTLTNFGWVCYCCWMCLHLFESVGCKSLLSISFSFFPFLFKDAAPFQCELQFVYFCYCMCLWLCFECVFCCCWQKTKNRQTINRKEKEKKIRWPDDFYGVYILH